MSVITYRGIEYDTEEDKQTAVINTIANQIGEDESTTGDYLKGAAFETGVNVATDAITTYLGWAPPLYALSNAISAGAANIYAQKFIRKEKDINWGEFTGATALGTIPYMNPAAGRLTKFVGKPQTIKRAVVGGAGLGLGYQQIEAGINEGRLITPGEATTGAVFGGAVGGGTKAVTDLGINLIKQIDTFRSGGIQVGQGIDTGSSSPSIRVDPEFNSPIRAERFVPETSRRRGVIIRKQLEANLTMGGRANRFNFIEFLRNPNMTSRYKRARAVDMSSETSVRESATKLRDEDMIDYLDLYGEAMDNTMVFDKKTKEWIYKPIQPEDIELDHKFTLVQSMGMYHNVSFGSPLWNQIQEIALRRGYRPGNTRRNLGLADPETHRVKSKFFNDLHGRDSGMKYWGAEHRNTGKTRLELMEQSHLNDEAKAIHLEIVEDYFNEIDTGSRILENALAYWRSKSTKNITTDQMVDELSKIVWEEKTLRTYLPSEVNAAIDAVEKNFTNPIRPKEEWALAFQEYPDPDAIDKIIWMNDRSEAGMDAVLDVLFEGSTPTQALKKWKSSNIQLELPVLKQAVKQAKANPDIVELMKARRGSSLGKQPKGPSEFGQDN